MIDGNNPISLLQDKIEDEVIAHQLLHQHIPHHLIVPTALIPFLLTNVRISEFFHTALFHKQILTGLFIIQIGDFAVKACQKWIFH